MSTINPEIDAAVVLMKLRAAEFNERREMGPSDTPVALLRRAYGNLSTAIWHDDGCAMVDVIDTMNLCALALSVLPKGGETS